MSLQRGRGKLAPMRLPKVTVLLLVLPGCGAGGLAAVRDHAAVEMSCDASKLKLTPDKPESNVFTVEGCGRIGRFWAACNIGGYCPSPQGQVVSTILSRQASFDLKCADVELSSLNTDTFAARGCGRQASYVLVGCEQGTCRAVQNTQAQ